MTSGLYIALLAGWMALATTALLGAGASPPLRRLLAVLFLGLCAGVGGVIAPDLSRAIMALCPALALCIHVFRHDASGAVTPFVTSGNAALALAFGRCDLLWVFVGASLILRLAVAHGIRGLDRQGQHLLRSVLGGLMMAQGGLFVLQAAWGPLQDQAGAVLLGGGLLMACGFLSRPGTGRTVWNVDALAVLPVLAQAAVSWPVLQPVLTFMGLTGLLWNCLPQPGRASVTPDWTAWAVLAAGLPGAASSIPLAASMLALACLLPDGSLSQIEAERRGTMLFWPPFLPGMALVLVLVAEMGHAVWVAVLAGLSLWPMFARQGSSVPVRRAEVPFLLLMGCVVLGMVVRQGTIQP